MSALGHGRQFVTENKTDAAGNIAAEYVVNAAPMAIRFSYSRAQLNYTHMSLAQFPGAVLLAYFFK